MKNWTDWEIGEQGEILEGAQQKRKKYIQEHECHDCALSLFYVYGGTSTIMVYSLEALLIFEPGFTSI